MSVETTSSQDTFTAVGGVGEAFTTSFPFPADTDLVVTTGPDVDGDPDPATTLTLGVDYSVTGGSYDVGTVTMITSRTAGYLVRIDRVLPLTQVVNLASQTSFTGRTVMRGLDRIVMMLQQLVVGVALAVIHGVQGGGTEHTEATSVLAGFMSAAHWSKVENNVGDVPVESTADSTLYLDPVAGNDSDTGTDSGSPLLTHAAVLAKIPFIQKHRLTVSVAGGTFVEKIGVDKWVGTVASVGGKIEFVGTQGAVTPATGLASGIVASQSGRTATVTAAGWTVNDLRDKFIRTTVSGELYPIVSNTATTVELATTTSINGLAFDIVSPTTIVDGGATAGATALYVNQYGTRQINSSPLTSIVGVQFRNYEFQASRCARTETEVKFYGCRFKYREIGTNCGRGGTLQANRSIYIPTVVSATSIGLQDVEGSGSVYVDLYLHGLGAGSSGYGLLVQQESSLSINATIVTEGFTYGAFLEAIGTVYGGALIARTNTYGLFVSGPTAFEFDAAELTLNDYGCMHQASSGGNQAGGVYGAFSSCLINSNTNDGIQLAEYGSVYLLACQVNANGRDAVRVMGPHCNVDFDASCDVSGNVGYAVKAASRRASHLSVWVDSTVTMLANGSADFTLDNGATAAVPIASVRTDPDDTTVDAAYFNRVVAP